MCSLISYCVFEYDIVFMLAVYVDKFHLKHIRVLKVLIYIVSMCQLENFPQKCQVASVLHVTI